MESLPGQRAQAESELGISTALLIVDNDPGESARETAEKFGALYESVPERGLAAVRNAALSAARHANALVFIDDDEVPHDGWLMTLVNNWLRGGAEFVSGRVVSTFSEPLDPWIRAGGFFRRVEFAENAPMRFAPTNNLLIDMAFVTAHHLHFDPDFGLSGGEDIRLTSQAVALGARIRAVPQAVVTDPVPAERTTRQWVLRRAYRVGTTTARCSILLHRRGIHRMSNRVFWLVNGMFRFGVGGLRLVFGGVSRSVVHRARGTRLMARGAGMCAGAFGVRYREYQARHSTARVNTLE
jgi:glycosyltransferase involved in cell wall biosynthesis